MKLPLQYSYDGMPLKIYIIGRSNFVANAKIGKKEIRRYGISKRSPPIGSFCNPERPSVQPGDNYLHNFECVCISVFLSVSGCNTLGSRNVRVGGGDADSCSEKGTISIR